jgi:gamma-tubulin complex component 2
MTIEKLESYLEMAIRTSSANADPFKDDVSCSLNTFGLIEQLFAIRNIKGALGQNAYGISTAPLRNKPGMDFKPAQKTLKVQEAFTLDYKVRWPLTLILSHKSITKY